MIRITLALFFGLYAFSVQALTIYECNNCEALQRLAKASELAQANCDSPFVYLYDLSVEKIWTYRIDCSEEEGMEGDDSSYMPHVTPVTSNTSLYSVYDTSQLDNVYPFSTPSYLLVIVRNLSRLERNGLTMTIPVKLSEIRSSNAVKLTELQKLSPRDLQGSRLADFQEYLLEVITNHQDEQVKELYRYMKLTASIDFDKHPVIFIFDIVFHNGEQMTFSLGSVESLPAQTLTTATSNSASIQ